MTFEKIDIIRATRDNNWVAEITFKDDKGGYSKANFFLGNRCDMLRMSNILGFCDVDYIEDLGGKEIRRIRLGQLVIGYGHPTHDKFICANDDLHLGVYSKKEFLKQICEID